MNKIELTIRLAQWLASFLDEKYSHNFDIEVVIPEANFSKLANENLKRVNGYPSFDFKTDVLGVMENRASGVVELVLMNRSTSAISLKEIGEMNCYCRLVKPKHAFLGSLRGLPEEVNLILLNNSQEQKLLKINDELDIVIFKWDEEKDRINEISVFPINQRENFK
jgi:hypothetical protein